MTVHLQKLSVGSESIQTLADWQGHVVSRREQQGLSAHHIHVTRMFPKRREEILDGGSIYWVIKGKQEGDQPADLTGVESGMDLPSSLRAKLLELGAW